MATLEAFLTGKGQLPHALIQGPTGRWFFAGHIGDGRLAYQTLDGGIPTEKQIKEACRFGTRLAGVKTLTFATREEAEAFEAALTA